MAIAYKRLLDAYTWSNRRDRDELIHEAEMLIDDAKWEFFPPAPDGSAGRKPAWQEATGDGPHTSRAVES
jgi:hypothetical protein